MTAKRAIWIVRAILYGSLALAAALVLAHRSGGGEDLAPGPYALVGKTGQGYRFAAVAHGDTVKTIGTSVDASCSNGGRYHWALSAGRSPRGAQVVDRGDDVRVRWSYRWTSTSGSVRIDAHQDGAALTGTIQATLEIRAEAPITCGSGKVAFRVHE